MARHRRADAVPLKQVLMALLVWPVLKLSSIHCFCCELCQYLKRDGQSPARPEDVIYDFWADEDINWRGWARDASGRIGKKVHLGPVTKTAFVTDDTLRKRRGKKVEGSSRHHDHTSGTTVTGQQLLELGLAGQNGYFPVDRQLYMSECAPVNKPSGKGGFKDHRSAAARDMARARDEEKPTMLARMLKDALKAGFKAAWLIADAWFGSKANIRLALEHGLHALFQMKRGNLQYRVDEGLFTANELYAKYARKMVCANSKSRFKTVRIEAELNLEADKNAKPMWQPVVLILSAPKDGGQDNWVIFLSTNTEACVEQLLEIYALRWSIEVYFKELKQSFGLLSEQSGKYQVSYASVHLAAVRYMIIFEAMLRNGNLSFGEVRDRQTGKLQILSFAALLWNLFRSIISGALDQFAESIGKARIQELVTAIDGAVEDFLSEAMQITPSHVQALAHAEACGAL